MADKLRSNSSAFLFTPLTPSFPPRFKVFFSLSEQFFWELIAA
jgi:hypothetical protein